VHFYGTAAEIANVQPVATRVTQFFQSASGSTVIEGKTWQVNYEVSFQFHDVAKEPLPSGFASIYAQAISPVQNAPPGTIYHSLQNAPGLQLLYSESMQENFAKGSQATKGFSSGDNIMSFQANVAIGLTFELLPSFHNIMRVYDEPTTRALTAINPQAANAPEALFRTMTHEIGHTLGFDERYAANAAGTGASHHERFETDFMTSLDPHIVDITFDPGHREASARFAIFAANGRNINNAAIRDPHVDSTFQGRIPEFRGGSLNPQYTELQGILEKDFWTKFRKQLTPPPPVQQFQYNWMPAKDPLSPSPPDTVEIFKMRFNMPILGGGK
jgi:hypothetical protein